MTTDRLIQAAKQRHEAAAQRAAAALREMATDGTPITFAAVARRAGVSTDFLYATPELRSRITDLRTPARGPGIPGDPSAGRPGPEPANTTSAIRALSTQLKQMRRQHREEITALQNSLAATHGENLELRRRLAQLED